MTEEIGDALRRPTLGMAYWDGGVYRRASKELGRVTLSTVDGQEAWLCFDGAGSQFAYFRNETVAMQAVEDRAPQRVCLKTGD